MPGALLVVPGALTGAFLFAAGFDERPVVFRVDACLRDAEDLVDFRVSVADVRAVAVGEGLTVAVAGMLSVGVAGVVALGVVPAGPPAIVMASPSSP
jgi:hypothetical protein